MKRIIFVPVLIIVSIFISIENVFAEGLDNVPSVIDYDFESRSGLPSKIWNAPNCYRKELDRWILCVTMREGEKTRNAVKEISEWMERVKKVIMEQQNRLEQLEKNSGLVALFATDTCPEGWTKTRWPYRKPIDNCTDENCKMVSVKELPGYVACEKK